MRPRLIVGGVAITAIAATLFCPEQAMALGKEIGIMIGKDAAATPFNSGVKAIQIVLGIMGVGSGIGAARHGKGWLATGLFVSGVGSAVAFNWIDAQGLMIP